MLENVLMSSVALLMVNSTWGWKTCNTDVGEYSYCQCKMSDGSGTIDLSRFGDANGNPT